MTICPHVGLPLFWWGHFALVHAMVAVQDSVVVLGGIAV
jgi:hypothetical protein